MRIADTTAMISLATALIFQGTLILSPSNPLTVPSHAQTLWFSKPNIVVLRQGSTKSFLEVQNLGTVHIVGLNGQTSSRKVLSVSDQNYTALKNCPLKQLVISNESLQWKGPIDSQALSRCRFEDLRLTNPEVSYSEFTSVEEKIVKMGFRIQSTSWAEGQRGLVLTGADKDLEQRRSDLKKILGHLTPFYKIEIRKTPSPGNTLVFELTLFEFSRDRAQELGLSWPTEIHLKALEGPLQISKSPDNEAANDLIADFGQSQGVGRILARPRLLSNPGEKSRFQSGGELPIRQTGVYSQSTQWKNYGLILELKAEKETKAGDQEVLVEFNLEISEPDESTAIDGVPGMLKRSLESRFALEIGKTTVLSSLQKIRAGKSQSGLIGFSELPIIGIFFSNNHNRNNESELWFAIKPSWNSIEAPDIESVNYEIKL